MSVTGLDIRKRAYRHVRSAWDRMIEWIDEEDDVVVSPRPPSPAAETVTRHAAPASTPNVDLSGLHAPPVPALEPLPTLPHTLPPRPGRTEPAADAEEAPTSADDNSSSDETDLDKQQAHWQNTRTGMLQFVEENGGTATLREMHEHSESKFFVAHVSFSRLMEEFVDEGLLEYDHDLAVGTLTDAGRATLG